MSRSLNCGTPLVTVSSERFQTILACNISPSFFASLTSNSSEALTMKRILILVFLLILAVPIYAQKPAPFKGCKQEGSGKRTKKNATGTLSKSKQELNLLKNRDVDPATIDDSITLATIMKPANDSKFTNEEGVSIIGYVAQVKAGEPQETCNCARKDIADKYM